MFSVLAYRFVFIYVQYTAQYKAYPYETRILWIFLHYFHMERIQKKNQQRPKLSHIEQLHTLKFFFYSGDFGCLCDALKLKINKKKGDGKHFWNNEANTYAETIFCMAATLRWVYCTGNGILFRELFFFQLVIAKKFSDDWRWYIELW